MKLGTDHWPLLLFLVANKLSRHLSEVPLRHLPKLIVAPSLLADHKFAAAVARVEPFGVRDKVRDNVWHRAGAGAIETHPRSQLHERTALRQLGRLFVFHANPRRAQAVLLRRHRAHQNLISASRSP